MPLIAALAVGLFVQRATGDSLPQSVCELLAKRLDSMAVWLWFVER